MIDDKTVRRMRIRIVAVFLAAFGMPVAFFLPLFIPAHDNGQTDWPDETILLLIITPICAAMVLAMFARIHMLVLKHSRLRIDSRGVSLRKYPIDETRVAFEDVIFSSRLLDKAGRSVGVLLRTPSDDLRIVGFGDAEAILKAIKRHSPEFEFTTHGIVDAQNEASLLLTLAALPVVAGIAGIGFRAFADHNWMSLIGTAIPVLVAVIAIFHGGFLLFTSATGTRRAKSMTGLLANPKVRGTCEIGIGLVWVWLYLTIFR
jgi:hypothetical protein